MTNDRTPPPLPTFHSMKPAAVPAVSPEKLSEPVTAHQQPVTDGVADEAAVGAVAALIEDETSDTTEPADSDQLDETHDGNRYGGPWAIIKHVGVVYTAVWAVLSAVASGAAAYYFAPQPAWIVVTVFAFFAGVIAAVDSKTHLIKNEHTLVTGIITVPLAAFLAFQLGPWNLLGGGISAAVTMGTLLLLAVFIGFGSGGDLKFSPLPGFVLGVINPILAALWFFLSLVVTMVLLLVNKKKEFAFGAGMVIAIPIALVVTKILFDAAGLPYL
jgi:hypothetical protein